MYLSTYLACLAVWLIDSQWETCTIPHDPSWKRMASFCFWSAEGLGELICETS